MSHTHRDVRRAIPALALVGGLILSAAPLRAQEAAPAPPTPAEMVATYNSLADAILAVKKTEEGLVRSIVAATFAHASAEMERARRAFADRDTKAAQAAIEMVAAEVGQLATEGDASVGAVRKRLLEGGHHHHANEEKEGIYDEGYVVVTRAAKQALLDASRTLAQVARDPRADAMEAQWKKVQETYDGLMK